jgi:hypothetical protein
MRQALSEHVKLALLALLASAALHGQVLNRPLLDAHNCYPYEGLYQDRIDRAFATGFPVAIEQDIAFFNDTAVVTHIDRTTGDEPTLQDYFFERVRPIVEKALAENHPGQWPLIVLHFDFKDLQAPLLHAVWEVLGEYESWITTATKTADPAKLAPFDIKPLLVLTEDADEQEAVFFNQVPEGAKLRVFGSAHTKDLTAPPTNYRRWLNYSWQAVEPEGQPKAGPWTEAKNTVLKQLVDNAHKLGYRIRFYTLDGYGPADNHGWFEQYNFGARAAVEARWRAAIEAGVDLIATDQYEALRDFMRNAP